MSLISWYTSINLFRICMVSRNARSAFCTAVSTSAGFTSPPVTIDSTALSACCCIELTCWIESTSTSLNEGPPTAPSNDGAAGIVNCWSIEMLLIALMLNFYLAPGPWPAGPPNSISRNSPQCLVRHVLRNFNHANIGLVRPRRFQRIHKFGRHVHRRVTHKAARVSVWVPWLIFHFRRCIRGFNAANLHTRSAAGRRQFVVGLERHEPRLIR